MNSFRQISKNLYQLLIPAVCIVTIMWLNSCGGMNGAYIEPPQGPKGLCSLVINNGYEKDIVVKLSDVKDPSKTLHYVFVAGKSTAIIKEIAPGNLTMKYSMGYDWDKSKRVFMRERANFESDRVFKFEETETETETSDGKVKTKHYSIQTYTMNPGIGEGNSTVSQIKDEEFNE